MKLAWITALSLAATLGAIAPFGAASCTSAALAGELCTTNSSASLEDGVVGGHASAESGIVVNQSAGAGTMGTGAQESIQSPIGAYLTAVYRYGPAGAIYGYNYLPPDAEVDVLIYHVETDNRYYSLCGSAPTLIAGQVQTCIPYLV